MQQVRTVPVLPRPNGGRLHALVVDDSATVRKILTAYLETMGFDVTVAVNGREALARLTEMDKADLALVDWNMPEMDGLSFLRAVRADVGNAALPIMMVTTNVELSRVAQALEAGANEYIMKPFTKDMVREKLELLGFQT
jgi:two-component system chemotaxis response regulator CheY